MDKTTFIVAIAMSFIFQVAKAADPTPLKDFCVGVNDPNSAVFVNGEFCKNPKNVTINDFIYKGFDKPGNTDNVLGSNATLIDITRFPGINTLGVSMARVDFEPQGLNNLHFHPRSSEVFTVMKGTFYAGFVTTEYKLYDTILKKGDMITFPQGVIHFQLNIAKTNGLGIVAFGSQNPGRIEITRAAFGSTPFVSDEVLTKAFQVDENVINQIRSRFSFKDGDNDNDDDISIRKGRMFMNMLSQAF